MVSEPPPPPPPRIPDECMHKNRLQQYAQKSKLPLPTYTTESFGTGPQFRSSVLVDGVNYMSAETFLHKKEAEQNVAKVALESILKKIKDEGCPILDEDMTYCKSILNEFAVKIGLEMPIYTTTESNSLIPVFVSTLDFHGKTYTSTPARSKKEAEQMGARSVIQFILGTEAGSLLSQIIKSKRKFFDALPKVSKNAMLPMVPCSKESAQIRDAPEIHSDVQLLKRAKLEHLCRCSTGVVENLTSDQTELIGGLVTAAGTSGSKHPCKKNKEKGQRQMMTDGCLQQNADSIILASPCSIAQ